MTTLREALDLLAFHEGSARPEHGGAQPTVWINGEDFDTILAAVRSALAQPPERGEGPQRLGYRMGIVDARHAAAKATDWTDHMKRLDALISDSYAPGSQPPPPDYVLGQERMRERAAVALPLELLRHLRGTLLQEAEGLEGVVTEDRLRLMAWLALLNDAIRIRSLPLEAASEGVRSCLWHADCDAADRALRDGVSPSHPPWPAPAAQTTPSPGTGIGMGFDDALRIARGCTDYGGGYRYSPEKFKAYQHGIQTVINALTAAGERGLADTQVAALHHMGSLPALPPDAGHNEGEG